MPRINDPNQMGTRPVSVTFGELAIAAGVVGESLTVCYDSLPAAHFCAICKFYLEGIGTGKLLHVRTQQQLKQVAKHLDSLQIILVQQPRLLSAVQWTIQTAISSSETRVSRPAILCCFKPYEIGDLPGPTLVLRNNQIECDKISNWLATHSMAAGGALEVAAYTEIHFEPAIAYILSNSGLQLRDRQVLSSLLAGASIVAAAGLNTSTPSELTVAPQHYQTVRQLLQSALVGPCEDGFDQLAVDMVNRANVYMSIKYGNDSANPFSLSERDHLRLRQDVVSRDELITRREIADLGNTKSRLVRELVEYLKLKEDGIEDFTKLGLIRRRPSATHWRASDALSLVQRLRSWSAKQVRTHFERLQREGLITAERTASNGPWWYALPEQLASAKPAFAKLPKVADLCSQAAHAG